MSSILTKDSRGLDAVRLFDNGIVIDQKLPKWVNASKRLSEKKKKEKVPVETVAENQYRVRQTVNSVTESGTSTQLVDMDTPFTVYNTPDGYEIDDRVDFDEVAAANLMELTELIKDGQLNNVLSGYGGMHGYSNNWVVRDSGPVPVDTTYDSPLKLMKSKYQQLKRKLAHKLDVVLDKPELDAIKFFTAVKLESKKSAVLYRDRVSKYLQAIHNANMVGQTALVEKLLSEMIANKYESLLYAKGKYYVIDEQTLVNFAKKTERGVDLCYVKNYTRPIPPEVIDEVAKANELEVFDNYVVLHYDPTGTVKKETRKEEAKRKDPILFGVIAGSHKLYYITDWIDENCDLTLEKFVDTIGMKKKDFLEGDYEEEKTEEKKEPEKKKTIRKRTSSKK